MIVLNLKTYTDIERSLLFADIADEIVGKTGLRIVVCPPTPYLKEATGRSCDIFAQHTDPEPPGAYTGSIAAEMLKDIKVKGSIINHSEKKLARDKMAQTIERLHMNGLESIVCAATTNEAASIVSHKPTFIAVEPPELIGKGISVSKVRPEIVVNSVRAIKDVNHHVKVLCGAGVSNKQDVKKALELGAEGVLLASAFVKAKDPKTFLAELAGVF